MCLMHSVNYTGLDHCVKKKSPGDVPFCPEIPDHYRIPAVAPGHHEHAESVVIVDVHSVVLYPGCYAAAGSSPALQSFAGLIITHDDRVQGLIGFPHRQGHGQCRL